MGWLEKSFTQERNKSFNMLAFAVAMVCFRLTYLKAKLSKDILDAISIYTELSSQKVPPVLLGQHTYNCTEKPC